MNGETIRSREPQGMPKDNESEKYTFNLGEFYREWARCHSFQYQRDQVYRFGRTDSCDEQWEDYVLALKAKFTKNNDAAREMIESTHLRKAKKKDSSSTVGVIWEAKQPPSWE